MIRTIASLSIWSCATIAAGATPASFDIALPPAAELRAEDTLAGDTVTLPTGPWSDAGAPTVTESGSALRQVWRVPETSLTTLQLIAPMREALENAGYEILFACQDWGCGGFDFRFDLDLIPEPEMHVNLGDYRFLAARGTGDTPSLVGIVVSRGAGAGYIHITRSIASAPMLPVPRDPDADEEQVETAAIPTTPVLQGGLADNLIDTGRVALNDLAFATGSSQLEPRVFPSLVELAAYLNATPEARVVLVGHSDATGALESNIRISRARAAAVVDRLIGAYNVAPGQLRAEGVGYLSPLAPNTTPEGRAANRRVEVIKVETE